MKIAPVVFVSIFCLQIALAQSTGLRRLAVEVKDSNGLAIENAQVTLSSNDGKTIDCQNKSSDEFVCDFSFEGDFALIASAEGFSILRRTVNATQDLSEKIELTLLPLPINENVIVTANRIATRFGDTAGSVVSLSQNEIRSTAAPTIDDALRQVPGFSLFRRSGSRSANPTTQGVSLRGVGASGAGRSLVMLDEIPINDPFGGWVQWSRIPAISVERIEVLRGGASSLYGNNSLSGTINVIPRRIEENFTFAGEVFAGSQRTFSGSTFFGFKKNDWSADFVAANFQNRGYIPIEETERGLADNFAGSRNSNFSARITKHFLDKTNVFFKSSYFGESRDNGTVVQKNRTHLRQFVLGGVWETTGLRSTFQNPKLSFRIFGGTQVFDQTFSAVGDDRNSENLVRLQRVPAQTFGVSVNFSAVIDKNHTFVFGIESKEVRGASDETGFFNNRAFSKTGSGGRERTFSLFVQDFARVNSKIILAGSVRYDNWKNFRALSSIRTIATNAVSTMIFSDRSENSLSPQISLLVHANDKLSFHALVSKSFRAPTLNELYRGFRVGNVVTNPNENLKAENAVNVESGAGFNIRDFYLRGNFFFTEISDPIANVTVFASQNLITRQRQNIGKTRSTGIEIDLENRIKNFHFSVGYLFADSRVKEFSANRELEGLRVPLVSQHQFTVQTNYANQKGWSFALQGRASSDQFDDDLNQFRLEPFFQLDAFGAKRFGRSFQVFAAIENLFNSQYSVGKTPVRTVGSPINGRIGIRWN